MGEFVGQLAISGEKQVKRGSSGDLSEELSGGAECRLAIETGVIMAKGRSQEGKDEAEVRCSGHASHDWLDGGRIRSGWRGDCGLGAGGTATHQGGEQERGDQQGRPDRLAAGVRHGAGR